MKRTMKLNIAMLLVAGLMMSSLNAGYFNDYVSQPLKDAASWVDTKVAATKKAVTPDWFSNKWVRPVVTVAKVGAVVAPGYKAVKALLKKSGRKSVALYAAATAVAAYVFLKDTIAGWFIKDAVKDTAHPASLGTANAAIVDPADVHPASMVPVLSLNDALKQNEAMAAAFNQRRN